ncbi:hypothetical protein BDW72DRAFT_196748 [Aspergillus terricola var. indicus]
MAFASSFFEMGIELALQGLDCDRALTSGDAVSRSLLLKLDRQTIVSNITVSLHGSVRTSLVNKGSPFILKNDLPTVAQENHQLFRLSSLLFPPRDVPQLSKNYTLSKREYSFPFEICFPEAPNSSDAHFPPSFVSRSETHGAEVNIEYVFRIDLKRPGRFRRRIAIERHLNFIPSKSAPIRSAYLYSGFSMKQAALYGHSSTSTPAGTGIPVLIMEAVLPSPSVLYAGGDLPVQLRIRRLPATLDCIPIKIQYIAISLRSTVTLFAELHRMSRNSSQALVMLNELDDLLVSSGDEESFADIKSSILDNTVVPEVLPSFYNKLVEQKYSLEVEAGFSLAGAVKSSRVTVAIEVDVWSGFCTENSERSIRANGTPEYLDLLGAFGAGVDRQPPPCYWPSMTIAETCL